MLKRLYNKLVERKLLVVLVLLFFAVNIFLIYTTFSEKTTSSIWDGKIATKFKKGSGTAADPYIINSGRELAYFFKIINDENSSEYFNKFYELTNNIDLNGYDFSFAASDKVFSGVFEGNGYSIYNFKIDNYYLSNEETYANYSWFNSLYGANIKNLNIYDISFNIKEDEIINKNKVKSTNSEQDYDASKLENDNKNETVTSSNETDIKDNNIKQDDVIDNKDSAENSTEKTDEVKEEQTQKQDEEKTDEIKEEQTQKQDEEKTNEENTKTDEVKEEIKEEQNDKIDDNENKENLENIETSDDNKTDEIVENKVESISVSLFRSAELSTIKNINIYGINIEYDGSEENLDSSLFLLEDLNGNKINNININGKSNVNNTAGLIKLYKNAEVNNIIYNLDNMILIPNYKEENDSFYKYSIKDGKLSFEGNQPVNSIINLLNGNSDFSWKFENNKFRIVNKGTDNKVSLKAAKRSIRTSPSAHASGIEGRTIYINDYDSDANYYEGLNYTYSSDGRIPTTSKKNIYNDTNLVYTEFHYHGSNIQGTYTGEVSATEDETEYVYYKIYEVNNNGTSSKSDDYILVDLIDNPFSKRPTDKVFESWITDYEDAVITLDMDVYIRRVKIPVTYSGNNPENIKADFYAVWANGKVYNFDTNWSTTFNKLDDEGFNSTTSYEYVYESPVGYYTQTTLYWGDDYPAGAVDANGHALTGSCGRFFGCTAYVVITDPDSEGPYYELRNNRMTSHTLQVIDTVYINEVPVGEVIAGYYRQVNIPRYSSLNGYYNANGVLQTSGTCNTNGGCNYYELIQYYDANGDVEVAISGKTYYYLTTRDTNVIVLNRTVNNVWQNSQDKPFTLTGINGNENYINSYYWDARTLQIYCYADTRIENLRIYGIARQSNDSEPRIYSNRNTAPAANSIYGNYHNFKIGRGIIPYNNSTVNFTYVIGGNMGNVSTMTNYNLIIESGYYNNLGLTTTYANSNYISSYNIYVNAKGIFGNDYDRITETDPETTSKLNIMYCLSGSWFGNIHGADITTPALFTNIKSGRFGTNKADYAAGVYFGGRGAGNHYSPRAGLVEGGWIYNLIGGPLSRSNIAGYNDTYIYMKGGKVDVIVGGAGLTTTYGNRIIQVTGGTVNYAVFGGSNGVLGENSDGTLDGDSYVYIGGNAVIGKPSLVSSNAIESISQVEAGSVFGIGNGNTSYSTIGTVNNSNVIIDGSATINKNVYGGGNYGATGQNGSNKTYQTNIIIHGGEIKGSVYGGGNNNGAGSTSNTCNISITMDDGEVYGSVYGGSKTLGRIYGSTDVDIKAGKIYTDVYGGGEGGYTSSTAYGTFVNGNVSVTVGDSNAGPTINGSVYGGSAYGTVNATSTNPAANSKTVDVTVNNGNIVGSVFGGAKGSSSFTPYVAGQITVEVNGGTMSQVFGGFDEAGKPAKDPYVNIKGGTITNVFGGGNKTSVDNTHVTVTNGTITTLYGGSNQLGDVLTTNVNIQGGITNTIFGGNNEGGTCDVTNVTVTNGKINQAIYGGGNLVSTTTTNVTINNAQNTIPNVFGGGNEASTTTTNVNLNNGSGSVNITNVFGGGNKAGATTTNVNLNNNSGSINIANVYGGSNESGVVTTSNVKVNKGTITNVFGGNNAGGKTNNSNVDINAGTITTLYGGGNEAETGNTLVNIKGGTITTAFGGGNEAKTDESIVNLSAGTVTTLYGGGNKAETTKTNLNITGGNATTVFGGGNEGSVDETHIKMSNGTVSTMYGGGNKAGVTNDTDVKITGGTLSTVLYGGGNEGAVGGNTNVFISKTTNTIPTVFGGGNKAGASETNVLLSNSAKITNVYGGSNQSGNNSKSNVIVGAPYDPVSLDISVEKREPGYYPQSSKPTYAVVRVTVNNLTASPIENWEIDLTVPQSTIFANNSNSNITVNGNTFNVNSTNRYYGYNTLPANGSYTFEFEVLSDTALDQFDVTGVVTNPSSEDSDNSNVRVTNVYGGNNAGGKTSDANVTINDGTVTTVYGGGNEAATDDTHVTMIDGTVTTMYGGGNKAGVTNDTNVNISGGTLNTVVYGGGNEGSVGGSTNVVISNTTNTIPNVFGGGNKAGASETNVTLNDTAKATSVYGGSNQQGNVDVSNVTVNSGTFTNVYGGNNAGGKTSNANVTINGGTSTNVYGGGNQAVSDSGTVKMINGTAGVIYAGGNAAGVNNNTILEISGGTVTGNVYGGGNEGTVGGNTTVTINNSNINGSAYAGGNGSTATVFGNTKISVGGSTVVGTSSCTVLSQCSVFGGGNAATTGSELTNNSTATVEIAGATVYGNVYGGANTSKVYGETYANIGADVPVNEKVTRGNISIKGTVFGGGEANASGSDEYDWTFVSVTKGIVVNINGQNYNTFEILGSIFGSGNASTAAGTSEVYVKNYGTFNNPNKNISIQRTDSLTIDNSAIILVGATDRENEYSDVLFSLSRIDELNLVNNSTLFLETGANLLQKFNSLTSSGSLASVNIDEESRTITKNVDNRVYMFIDKKLNIAKNQSVTDYGEVHGMSFFGMYKYNGNGTVNTGIYDKHNYGDSLDWGSVFDNVSSYVLGLHNDNHNIYVDGFYTNYMDEETATNIPDYIVPTPPTGPLYMWTIGEGVIEYEIDLVASKYSTLGTAELSLRDFTEPNTSFQILGFDYSEIADGVQLIDKNDIKKIADTEEQANSLVGLSMESSNIGWLTNGYTQFLSNEDNPILGTQEYVGGNNDSAPTLLFYLHHSKNISGSGDLGTARIQLLSIRQIDALTKETKRLIVTVNMTRTLFDTVNYEGAMTAGRKYDLFTSTATNITSSSAISAYFSLFNAGETIYRNGYHRSLVSNYVLPENTKITMIDLAKDTPEYYYHIITSTDVANATQELANTREISYDLSMFEKMGALNSGVYYNDAVKNSEYCSTGEYCNEDYVFIIDFGDTNITSNALGNQLLIEIRNDDNESIYTVLAPQHQNMVYNIYANKDAIIDMDGTIDKNKIYNGESLTADLTINYTQSMVGSTTILDTHYFDSKLGVKISLINEDGDVVTGTTLLGLYYEIDNVRYYPNIDGTTRIKIADKVDSAEKWVIVNTGTSKIASGNYKLRFESFGSPDGIYYGLNSSDTKDFNIEIVNEIYGLDISTTAEEMIINKDTGNNESGSATIKYDIEYNSGLKNPSIHIKMYRRNYNTIDDTTYSLVDMQDYFDNALVAGNQNKEYILIDNPNENTSITLRVKDSLVSGTYKMEFILYDGTSAIGTVNKYIIIK